MMQGTKFKNINNVNACRPVAIFFMKSYEDLGLSDVFMWVQKTCKSCRILAQKILRNGHSEQYGSVT
jgi:hypothetical protein